MALILAFWIICASPAWAAETVDVSILMPAPFAVATEELVEDYNKRQSHIRLKVERGPLNTEAISDLAISSLLLGDTPYDLLLMDVTWTPKYVAANWLLPLEPLLGEKALDPLLPGAQIGNTFGGHLWRMPLLANTGLLFYRKDLLEQPPRDTKDLVQQSRRLQQQGRIRWGYVWQGRQYEGLSCVFLEVLHGFGGGWIQGAEPGIPALDDPAAKQAASWLKGLIIDGISPRAVVNMSESETLQSFAAGDALFMRNWPYAWAELEKPGSPLAGKVGVTLPVAAPGHQAAATQGSWGLSLLKGSKHPEEAAEVIRWLTSADVQKTLFLSNGYPPTLSELYEDETLISAQPLLPLLHEALDHAVLRPETPLYAQLSDLLQRRLSNLFTTNETVDEAMTGLQQQSKLLMQAAAGNEN